MDGFFSLKGKEAVLVSGFFGIIVHFLFLGGQEDQNKFYYVFLGYGAWILLKNIYWSIRVSRILRISKYDILKSYEEVNKIRKFDENRADRIEEMIFSM